MKLSNDLKIKDQMGINKIGQYINTSVQIIGRDSSSEVTPASKAALTPNTVVWHDYMKKLDIPSSFGMSNSPGEYQPLSFSSRVLPASSSSVALLKEDPTFDANAVGNSLLFLTQEDSVVYRWDDPFDSSKKFKRVFNLYQFHYFYLAKKENNLFKGGINYILVHWTSHYFLDYNELSQLSLLTTVDSSIPPNVANLVDMNSMLSTLSSSKANSGLTIPISGVIKYSDKTTGGTASPRFYSMSSWNTKVSYADTSFIKMWSQENIFKHVDNDVLYSGIASNSYKEPPNSSSLQYSSNQIVPLFANTKYVGDSSFPDGFPHGFEVMASGSSGGKKVFMRVVSKGEGYSDVKVFNESNITFQGKSS